MSGVLEDAVAIVVAMVLAWLAWQAWYMRNAVVRIGLGIVSQLPTLVVALVAVVGLLGIYKLYF
jgi:type III secretory pathway component EscV